MALSLAYGAKSIPVRTVDRDGPAQVKAERIALVGRLVSEAMRRSEGSQKNAALDMRKDLSLLGRQLRTGKTNLSDLADLSDAFFAEWGKVLVEQFGDASVDQKARARQMLPELVEKFLEAVGA